MLVDRPIDAPRDAAEPPEVSDDRESDDGKDDRFCALREATGREYKVVEHVGGHKDGKVEGGELIVVEAGRKVSVRKRWKEEVVRRT